MWEHFVLNEIQAQTQTRHIFYWRDKRGHEIDFIWKKPGSNPIAIECKWKSDNFNPLNIKAFRRQYPEGENIVVSQDIDKPFKKTFPPLSVNFMDLHTLINKINL